MHREPGFDASLFAGLTALYRAMRAIDVLALGRADSLHNKGAMATLPDDNCRLQF